MTAQPLHFLEKNGKIERRAEVVEHQSAPNQIEPNEEVRPMADCHSYGDSIASGKPVNSANKAFGLTAQQRALLNFLEAFNARNSTMPSYEEMKEALGLQSKSGVHRLMEALERKGHVRRERYAARGIILRRSDDVSTGRALDIVLTRCRMTPDTERELRMLLAHEQNASMGAT